MECLRLLIFAAIVAIVTTSNDAQTNSEVKFCQIGAYQSSHKEACSRRCLSYRGFIHPITKELICFNTESQAVALLGLLRLTYQSHCQCGVTLKSDIFLCKPEITYGTDEIEECSTVCPQYTGYMLEEKNLTELLYCSKPSEMEILELGSLVSRVNKFNAETNQNHRLYECKCAVGLDGMQLAFPKRKKPTKRVVKNVNDFDFSCQDTVPFTDTTGCLKRCGMLKGYISNSSKQLICFGKMNTATVISNVKDPCACGYKTNPTGSTTTRDKTCNPQLVFDNIKNYRECKLQCSKYTVLRRKAMKGVYENVWCEKELDKTKIIEDLRWSKEEIYNEESTTPSYNCVCGKPSIREMAGSDELAASCSVGTFEACHENSCQTVCRKAKGYFVKTETGNQLICYQRTKVGHRIPSYVNTGNSTVLANTTCECGVIFNELRKDTKYFRSCVPEVKYEIKTENDRTEISHFEKKQCHETCRKHTAFVFFINRKPIVVRCESNEFSTQIYDKLDWQGEVLKSGQKFQCECGLTSQSLSIISDANININTIRPNEAYNYNKMIRDLDDNLSEKIVPNVPSSEDKTDDERVAAASLNESICSEINEDELYQALPVLPPDPLSFLESEDVYDHHDITVGIENDIPFGIENDVPVGIENEITVGIENEIPIGIENDIPVGIENEIPAGDLNNLAPIYGNEIEYESILHPKCRQAIHRSEEKISPNKKQDTGDNMMRNNDSNFNLMDDVSYLLVNQSLTMTIDDLLEPQYQEHDEFMLPVGDYEIPSIFENILQRRNKRTRHCD